MGPCKFHFVVLKDIPTAFSYIHVWVSDLDYNTISSSTSTPSFSVKKISTVLQISTFYFLTWVVVSQKNNDK